MTPSEFLEECIKQLDKEHLQRIVSVYAALNPTIETAVFKALADQKEF